MSLITAISDGDAPFFTDTTAAPSTTFAYKIVSGGAVSNGRTVTLPGPGAGRLILQPDARDGKATYVANGSSSGAPASCVNYGAFETLRLGMNTPLDNGRRSSGSVPRRSAVLIPNLSTGLCLLRPGRQFRPTRSSPRRPCSCTRSRTASRPECLRV